MAKRAIESIVPFLSFQGQAEEALALYLDAFPTAKVTGKVLFKAEDDGVEGKVKQAFLTVGDNVIRVLDVPMSPGFHFSAALSLFVEVGGAKRLDAIAETLGTGGQVLMPADTYPFAERFVWLADRFGVNWQLAHGLRAP
ncbi:MAG: VOC family protein [Pseudomonadota bacterium]